MHESSHPPSRFRAFTSAIGLTSPASQASSSATRNDRAFSTSSQPPPQRANFMLSLRVHSASNLSAVTQGSYCKLYVGETPITGGFGDRRSLVSMPKPHASRTPPTHRTFHTKVQLSAQKSSPQWNEKFHVNVFNPHSEVLTIRVKNQVLLYSPAVGACVVHLRQLQLGETVDNWFPLFKNERPAGQIRLQLCLQANAAATTPVNRYSGVRVSEETIQRLTQEQENMRREVEVKQQQEWKRLEEEELKRVGLQGQMLQEQDVKVEPEKEKAPEPEPPSYYVDDDSGQDEVQSKENATTISTTSDAVDDKVASMLMKELSDRQAAKEENQDDLTGPVGGSAFSNNTSNNSVDSYADRRRTGFGTIRFSFEDLADVVQNALPSSDSSESSSSEEVRRRRKPRQHSRKSDRHKSQRYSRSDSSSYTSTEDRQSVPNDEVQVGNLQRKATYPSEHVHQSPPGIPRRNTDASLSLTFASSSSQEATSSEERHHHRHREMKKSKSRHHRSDRRHKSRRYYDSSDSSSSSSSSSLSSSEEERLIRKLKRSKAKKLSRAKARSHKSSKKSAHTRDTLSFPDSTSSTESPRHHEVLQFSDSMRASSRLHKSSRVFQTSTASTRYVDGRDDSEDSNGDRINGAETHGPNMTKQGDGALTGSFCF